MGIHTIFIPLLICIGISGYTDAQRYDFNLLSVAQSIFPIADMKPEVFVKLVNKKCEKNDGSGAFMIASEKIQNVTQCIASWRILIHVNQSSVAKHPKEMTTAMIEVSCPPVSYVKSCMNEFKENNPCLGPVEIESVKVIMDVIISILKFGCNNNGENFKKLINEGGVECLKDAYNKMQNCTKQEFTDKMRKNISKESSTSEPQEFPLSVPDKDCARLEKVIDCYLHALQQCGKPEVTNVMKDLYSETLVGFRCKNSVNWQSSPVNPQSSPVNSQSPPVSFIILVFVTAVTALRL